MSYKIRLCEADEDFAGCATLQKETCGYSNYEIYPLRMFLNVPGVGAFTPREQMAGFVVSIPAWSQQRPFYHSLLLGVLHEHENRGLGRMLKIGQRKGALAGKDPDPARRPASAEVVIPLDLDSLLARRPAQARKWQSDFRVRLRDCFSRECAIIGPEKRDTKACYFLDCL